MSPAARRRSVRNAEPIENADSEQPTPRPLHLDGDARRSVCHLASCMPPKNDPSSVSKALLKLVSDIPESEEHFASDPKSRAQQLAKSAARTAAGISAALAIPPGPLGLATILPDLIGIWHVQRQLVADIAAVYGKTGSLTPTAMVYCLFKHGSAALVRDLVVRVGERIVIKRATLKLLQELLSKIGVRVTQKVLGRTLSRWIPLIGALGIGAYAYYDTSQVAGNAIELFSKEIGSEFDD